MPTFELVYCCTCCPVLLAVCSYCNDSSVEIHRELLPELLNFNVIRHNYMIKRLLLAAIAAAGCFMPAAAEIQPGTASLIETVDENGILVTINHPECAAGTL